ncbi:MAG: hypothetical protein A3J46_05850 [Candidatus Yanofskybacteria bacterium RIFCSPHIGHO2_02_FULL_41_11]|uniref:DUF4044 domain-containing protein n=1 Tax=Candidatus Yanofskybacteria bacterium RIFCSPHIGHO2_02_FULL_41_11 TaxID=1802675 RepID=A0A1F8F5K9_9BACT|nr:MAG: hypothetical protein A3J46_05850 [Candidatus Yanofskybacteria bacterium RIFCSPHIGHO2_02_FULL_41_11]
MFKFNKPLPSQKIKNNKNTENSLELRILSIYNANIMLRKRIVKIIWIILVVLIALSMVAVSILPAFL